ncbi:MAG: hypothetical protein WC565_07555 [Parcubacteria group bacterium]
MTHNRDLERINSEINAELHAARQEIARLQAELAYLRGKVDVYEHNLNRSEYPIADERLLTADQLPRRTIAS